MDDYRCPHGNTVRHNICVECALSDELVTKDNDQGLKFEGSL